MADTAKFVLVLKDQVSRNAQKASASVGRLKGDMVRSNRALASMSTGLSTAGVAAGVAAGGMLAFGAAAVAAGRRVAHSEQLTMMFDRLTHHGKETFREVRDLSKELGLDIDATAHAYGNFLKLQFSENQAKKMVKLGADLQALGANADDVQGIFRAMGQIKSKGKLQAEELLQLSERGVSGKLVKEEIAKIMGIAEDEVEGLQRAGKISGDVGLQAIERALNRKLGQKEAGEAGSEFANKSLIGMVNRAKAGAEDFWIEIADAAKPGLKAGFGSIAKGLADFFGNKKNVEDAKNIMSAFGEAVKVAGKWVGELLPLGLELVTTFGSGVADGLGKASDKGNEAGSTLEQVKQIMTDLKPIVGAVGYLLGKTASALQSISAGAAAAAHALGLTYSAAGEAGKKSESTGLELGKAAGLAIGNGMFSGLMASMGLVKLGGGLLSKEAGKGVNEAAEIHSPSRMTEESGRMLGAGLERGMHNSAPNGGALMRHMASPRAIASQAPSGGGVNMGGVKIEINGAGDPFAVAREVERHLRSLFTRTAMEMGA
jgi:tape measure domain-containing protein